ncbi:MAG: choice-of-anchor L domain-containing protein, partial [Chitinophagaceae bacterium]
MRPFLSRYIIFPGLLFLAVTTRAQLQVTASNDATALAQKLVGDGVTISDAVFTGNSLMAGFFTTNSFGNTNIAIDSGIVLTNGAAASRNVIGVSGASNLTANNHFRLPGDPSLSAIVMAQTFDACVLEFNFVPLGDTVRFNYVFSSEEYPAFACSQYNDAFAFFISGPGFPGPANIALIPNSTAPVTIRNINDQSCAAYPQYYINNQGNQFFTHNGLTKVLTAVCRVQPCQSYHLKLVIADVSDDILDSGVFLQAKSLSSNVVTLKNVDHIDPAGNSYLAEGCNSFPFTVTRPKKDPLPLLVNLVYGGSATNGVDVQLLPSSVTIPANDSFVTVNISAVP